MVKSRHDLIEGLIYLCGIVKLRNIHNRASDGVVKRFRVSDAEHDVGSYAGRDRRKNCSGRNQLKVDLKVTVFGKTVVDQSADDLRLVLAGGDPDGDVAGLLTVVGRASYIIIVHIEGRGEHLALVGEVFPEVGVGLGQLLLGGRNLNPVKTDGLSRGIDKPS